MARCSCATTSSEPVNQCFCLVQAGENVDVVGVGSAADPYIVIGDDTFFGMTVFNTAGTFPWDPALMNDEIKYLRVRCVGGGGGSASTGATIAGQGIARGGGGGGAYTEGWVSQPVAAVTITVGAGGTGGTPGGTPTAGGAGGASSFGALVVANGGSGSGIATAPGVGPLISAGGNQGAAGVVAGQVSIAGQPGTGGFFQAVGIRMGGAGGSAGGLGVSGVTNFNIASGLAGRNYGGGASGSAADGVNAGQVGAAGSVGIVIVEAFG